MNDDLTATANQLIEKLERKEYPNPTRQNRILKFLIEANKVMDGMHIEETTEYDHPRWFSIKFEASLTCPYTNGGFWSPNKLFWTTINKIAKKHFLDFKYSEALKNSDWNLNNTGTVFWIKKEKV
jgi:hypothetical protein